MNGANQKNKSIFKLSSLEFVTIENTKTMTFKGKDAVRSKIVINENIIEQVNTLRCLGNEISYQGEVVVSSKIAKFLRVNGLINSMLRSNKPQKETRLKVYNTLAVPVITYECET